MKGLLLFLLAVVALLLLGTSVASANGPALFPSSQPAAGPDVAVAAVAGGAGAVLAGLWFARLLKR
ncbi:MAG TPA: hypothetical protein VM529_07140 [Gemmata sp.]|nr:hypothetical protein [Gemmata sp.]